MKRLSRIFPVALCATGLAAFAHAQGSDSCATPQAISGIGTFNFTTGTTGAEGQSNPLCNQFGQIGIDRDVWFNWTAPSTANFQATTCGGATIDTKMAVYNGGGACPGAAAIACSDDACGLQSTVSFAATSGSVYKIQLGVFPGVGAGSGTFSIDVGGTSCPSAVGPDIIVGDIQGIANYTFNTTEALSLGTYSCNVGTVDVLWQANNNRHPVIGGSLHRYKIVNGAGRFEQVGMSWLKHGFLALTDDICCICTGPSGSVLSVGCADPYTAARNGSQSGLGPRWQVNAHTGVFNYPPANPGFSGSDARRLQVATSDLEVTSGSTTRYFGETIYVTQDDAAAGNGNNNASYREVTVSGSGTAWTFGLTGTTKRTLQAIKAWQTIDPAVTLTNVQVPSEGLFVVGSKATDLGGGQWHYEYAVYNMNSDRNGGSFSVPVDGGVSVSNIGFHDVTYRNGDGPGNVNFSGTDWVGSVSGGAVTWATETQAANPSANAIRWASLYNFRFDANVAPQNGGVTLGLWKTGSPASTTAAAQIPGNAGTPVTSFCFGDGSGTLCPCGNIGAAGNGCASSVNASGANLASSGTPSIGADTFTLLGSGMPNSSALYFQGTSQSGGGAGTVFGDGLRCAAGSVIRLGTKLNVAGASQYPEGGDLSISVKGGNAIGNVRTYQCWYRNAAAFCTSDTFNLTQGLEATWAP